MLSRRLAPLTLLSVVGASLAATTAAPASGEVTDLAGTLGLPAGVTASVVGSAATATPEFNDFGDAVDPDPYLLLSTGDAADVFGAPADAQLSTDRGADGAPDSSTLTLTVQPAAGVGCLFVDFALGTEELVHQFVEETPGDQLSITRAAAPGTDYATNAGRGYFEQVNWPAQPKPYQVNALDYWHQPGDRFDPLPGTAEEPRLPKITALNHVTTRDTARIPLTFAGGPEVIDLQVRDAVNGDLDSVAFVDHVRVGASCAAGTGVEPNPVHQGGVIAGIRGVGNALVYDPIPSTEAIERYDDPGNGWRSPSNVPVELRFRWYRTSQTYALSGDMRNWTPIQDADRQAYVPTAGDRGKVLIVLVTGFVDGRRAETFPSTGSSGTWYVTTPIDYGTFVEGEAPVIVGPSGGTAAVGEKLIAQIGHTSPREDTWNWQWYANGSTISGATSQELTLGAAQAGKTITVKATAKRLNFDDKSWTSAPYGPIELQQWDTTGVPTIVVDGTPAYGKTLTADPGAAGWTPTPTSYSYQWKRDGAVISGATFASYPIKTADVGAELTVEVSGVRTGYLPTPRESEPVEVLGATMTGATPTVSGLPKVGQRLTANATGWQPSGSTLRYAWYAGDTLLQEGTSIYLTVPPSAAGQPIVLRVTGTKSGYTPLTLSSTPTAPIEPGTITSSTPRISGTARVGETLVALAGSWDPRGVKLGYRWKIGSTAVTGKAGSQTTFKIPRKAKGKKITVVVTGRLSGYATEKETSAPTSKVGR